MATGVEPPREREQPAAGVILDARARQARRRRIGAAVAIALAGAALVIVLITIGGDAKRASRAPAGRAALIAHTRNARPVGQVSPALEGGSYGWEVRAAQPGSIGVGGSCCTLPTMNLHTHGPWVGVVTMSSADAHSDALIALLPGRVRGFRARGVSGTVITLARLRYGLRLAAITFPRRPHQPAEGAEPHGLLALDARGRPLGYVQNQERFGAGGRWWQAPQAPPSGPCEIRARGLTGLQAKWGHVAASVGPYPRQVIGRAFLSCVDAEYYLQHWPLTAAVLLDAQHPGARPAPIPGQRPAPRARGVVEAPSDWHGTLTAERVHDAWLVVAGGSGPAQRLLVLRHILATIALR